MLRNDFPLVMRKKEKKIEEKKKKWLLFCSAPDVSKQVAVASLLFLVMAMCGLMVRFGEKRGVGVGGSPSASALLLGFTFYLVCLFVLGQIL